MSNYLGKYDTQYYISTIFPHCIPLYEFMDRTIYLSTQHLCIWYNFINIHKSYEVVKWNNYRWVVAIDFNFQRW